MAKPSRISYELRQRSLVKSLTFRVTVVVSDTIVIYLLTHQVSTTIQVTILTNVVSMILYYTHERIWNLIRWGRR